MLEDRDLGPGSRGDMGELGGDVASADQHDPARQAFHLKEALVVDQVLLAGDAQLHRLRPGRQNDVPGLQCFAIDLNSTRANEASPPVEGRDAAFGEALLLLVRHRVRKAALERQQLVPVDPHVALDSLAAHPSGVVGGRGASD